MSTTKGRKPKKPSPSFPLTPHPCGSWCKKIGGTLKYFGPWADPDGALRNYQNFAAGRTPRHAPDGSITMRELGNRFLTYQRDRAGVGQITYRSFRNFNAVVLAFVAHVRVETTAGDLHPDVFGAYWLKLAKRLGREGVKKHVSIVRQMFRWGFNQDLIDRPVKFGSGFTTAVKVKPKPVRLFDPAEIRRMLGAAGVNLKAMILLGVNCGFGQTDIASLPIHAVNLAAGYIDFPRPKTGNPRRCPLWPETVAALKAVAADRPRAIDKADAGLYFLTRGGTRYVRETPVRDAAGNVTGVLVSDSVGPLFLKMMGRAGLWKLNRKGTPVSDGRNFYTLRRSFRTWADEVRDQHAADVIMGHAHGTTGGGYVQHVDMARLKVLTDHVRSKLFRSTE